MHWVCDMITYSTQDRGWWTDDEEAALKKQLRSDVLAALDRADKQPKAPIVDLFNDVYDEPTPILNDQMEQLRTHLAEFPDAYPVKGFKSSGPGWPSA